MVVDPRPREPLAMDPYMSSARVVGHQQQFGPGMGARVCTLQERRGDGSCGNDPGPLVPAWIPSSLALRASERALQVHAGRPHGPGGFYLGSG